MNIERSIAFDYVFDIAAAARIVTAGTSSHTPEQLAAQYALEAARESGYAVDADALSAHLDFLVDAGAVFDPAAALQIAIAAA